MGGLMKQLQPSLFFIKCGLGLLFISFPNCAPGQGTLTPLVLQTDAVNPLVSATNPLPAFPSAPVPLEFEFGFATDEAFGPGGFFDSVTLTLQDQAMNHTLIIATADAGGFAWAPATPGALEVDPNSIIRTPIGFPSLTPVLNLRVAFHVIVPVPPQFNGLPASLYLDLSDNLNTLNSIGYFKLITVPEPAVGLLAGLGGLGRLWLKRRK